MGLSWLFFWFERLYVIELWPRVVGNRFLVAISLWNLVQKARFWESGRSASDWRISRPWQRLRLKLFMDRWMSLIMIHDSSISCWSPGCRSEIAGPVLVWVSARAGKRNWVRHQPILKLVLILHSHHFNLLSLLFARQKWLQRFRKDSVALTADYLFESSLRNLILSLVSFDEVLEALSHDVLNLIYLQQEWLLPPVKEIKHLSLQKFHRQTFALIIRFLLILAVTCGNQQVLRLAHVLPKVIN